MDSLGTQVAAKVLLDRFGFGSLGFELCLSLLEMFDHRLGFFLDSLDYVVVPSLDRFFVVLVPLR